MTSPLHPAVQRLIDREDIRDAHIRYARGMDRHDLALVASAFHVDGRDRHGSFEGGPDDVARWAHRGHTLHYTAHNHYLGNVSFTFEGDDVCFTETYFHIVLHRISEPTGNDVLGGRYLDRLEKRDGTWAIVDREVVLDWKGEHLPIDPVRDHEVNKTYPAGQWSDDDLSYTRVADFVRTRV
ncbi:hypothetical protein DC31_15955 [Microbacterium sp. CH12i]|uniref:nuclear transport factor 2 family protein n=1 Tax=Microbacterium sp. CH12i TaxID=1479651 RepID=UPI00046142F9|nr:nuclear transport factor 2 family protein [Microbacterium sp. CH12i]KDA05318.1 hypothetical protein DC31_15955 [Microbacterium sp. CH12i]